MTSHLRFLASLIVSSLAKGRGAFTFYIMASEGHDAG
jgi:hypothetical protein